MVFSTFGRLALFPALLWLLALGEGGSTLTVPRAPLEGMIAAGPADPLTTFHFVIELAPQDPELDSLASAVADPGAKMHHATLTHAAFVARFGRPQADIDRLTAFLRANGASEIYVSSNRLVLGADMTSAQAQRAFSARFLTYKAGSRTAVAPESTLHLPIAGVRDVRGAVIAYSPRLNDVPSLPNDFRGDWYLPQRFREGYDAVPDGGTGARIVLLQDSSDHAERADIQRFFARAPIGADIARVIETNVTAPVNNERCSRDDRGQEPTTDIVSAIVLAPKATIDVRYDDLCVAGTDGTLPLQRALDANEDPAVVVIPVAAGPVYGPSTDAFGPVPIPYLEAAIRGIPIVVSAGDDGAYGFRLPGLEKPAVTYPCVLAYAICAGGSQLGQINDDFSEGPWNDRSHATGGGISQDPRPSWQAGPENFEFSPSSVRTRIVPDLAADAAGHLLAYWRSYGFGGVGGTSESASLIGAQIAAINGAVPLANRLLSPGDLYALASAHPEAFRDIFHANDRGLKDNTIRQRRLPLPLDYRGPVPTPPPTVAGCLQIQPHGCEVVKGYDAVTGLGSIRESAAISALSK